MNTDFSGVHVYYKSWVKNEKKTYFEPRVVTFQCHAAIWMLGDLVSVLV